MSKILLGFKSQEMLNGLLTVEFIHDMMPTEIWIKPPVGNDGTMWLFNGPSETPIAAFQRCLTIIHRSIKKNLTGDEALALHLNLNINTMKRGTIALKDDILVTILSLEPQIEA